MPPALPRCRPTPIRISELTVDEVVDLVAGALSRSTGLPTAVWESWIRAGGFESLTGPQRLGVSRAIGIDPSEILVRTAEDSGSLHAGIALALRRTGLDRAALDCARAMLECGALEAIPRVVATLAASAEARPDDPPSRVRELERALRYFTSPAAVDK